MTAIDRSVGGLGEPAVYSDAISPSDDDELATVSRALFVGGAGDVAVVMLSGDAVTYAGVTAGSFLPIRVKQVKATGTTATLILNLY